MDFFANAFVERDKVDESNVVVKDGIQIRENAIAASSDVVNCEVCGKVTAKYKCPGCFCQTCSLQCSKQHKLDTTCSGVRSRIHFVERKQYSEQDMMSDYNFLEEVGRTVDNAARENVKLDAGLNPNRKRILGANHQNKNNKRTHMQNNRRQSQQDASADGAVSGPGSVTELSLTAAQELEKQGAEGSGSYRDKQLILQAKKRGTHLIMMADGLKKRKENNTHWRDKPSRFLWTIEWLFPEMETSTRILEHKNEESKSLKDILAGTLSKPENSDVAGKYPCEQLDQCRFYFVIPLRHANQPALYPLKASDKVQDALQFKKVLEYPTIIVVGPSTASEASSSGTVDGGSEQAGGAETLPSVLAKYSIEEPPTEWPKKPTTGPQQTNQPLKDQKRSNETAPEGEAPGKKVKTAGDESKESSDASSDESDSDSDSDSDDSSDDSDSDDSSDDDDDQDTGDKEDKDVETAAAKAISGDEETDTRSGHTEEDVANASVSAEQTNLELGQAILEAFNQDFGQTESQ